jgi:hypothetical protein
MKKFTTLMAASLALSMLIVAPVGANSRSASNSQRQVSWAEVVQEQTQGDAPEVTRTPVGWSRLVRTDNGLKASVFVRGLKPGGVYTFWWVSPYEFVGDDPVIPGGVFVARGAGRVIGSNGTAFVRMKARAGQAGIEGFPVPGAESFHEMKDPLTSIVRIEIAYHGQADEAENRAEVRTWLSDFWTGAACPSFLQENQAGQPHCPVYLAATHMP